MNLTVRRVAKTQDIFKYADLVAIKNKDDSYYIVKNNFGESSVEISEIDFYDLMADKSEQPIVLNHALFTEKS